MTTKHSRSSMVKFIICSIIGIFMFFVSIPYNGKSSIPIDHLTTIIRNILGIPMQRYCVLAVVLYGTVMPFVRKTWNKTKRDIIFTGFRLIGLLAAIFYVFQIGPSFLLTNKDLLPYMFETICCNLCFLIPLGTIFLIFLTNYGLMEFAAVFLQPIMRKVWKIPGKAAIDMIASFLGSYSIALVLTDNMYQTGRYNKKEAYIIATGFSTVSASFLIVLAKTLDLMPMWNFYFWTSMLVTFLTTAVVLRIYPTSKVPTEYMEGVTPKTEDVTRGNFFSLGLENALQRADKSGSVLKDLGKSVIDGLNVVSFVIPNVLSIGLIGACLVAYTPVFDFLGYIFYPFTLLMRIPEALPVAQNLATSIADVFFPATFAAPFGFDLATRYIIGVVSVSELLFCAAVVPCILSTKIPVKFSELLIIWVERVIVSIILASLLALLL